MQSFLLIWRHVYITRKLSPANSRLNGAWQMVQKFTSVKADVLISSAVNHTAASLPTCFPKVAAMKCRDRVLICAPFCGTRTSFLVMRKYLRVSNNKLLNEAKWCRNVTSIGSESLGSFARKELAPTSLIFGKLGRCLHQHEVTKLEITKREWDWQSL